MKSSRLQGFDNIRPDSGKLLLDGGGRPVALPPGAFMLLRALAGGGKAGARHIVTIPHLKYRFTAPPSGARMAVPPLRLPSRRADE